MRYKNRDQKTSQEIIVIVLMGDEGLDQVKTSLSQIPYEFWSICFTQDAGQEMEQLRPG